MDSQEKDTINLMQQYEMLTYKINNFRGADSYIVETIERIASLPEKKEIEVTNLRQVSVLLTKIAFNSL
jgi:hypothetical protein